MIRASSCVAAARRRSAPSTGAVALVAATACGDDSSRTAAAVRPALVVDVFGDLRLRRALQAVRSRPPEREDPGAGQGHRLDDYSPS